jgi:SAM-dependent methyltransferase
LVWESLERRHLLAGARILEIGCGGGGFAWQMADSGADSVVAQDYSTVAIERASSRYRRDNLTFEVGDIGAIRYPDRDFDVVISCETIEHVPDPQTAVSELARVLSPEGALLLTTPNYMSISGLHRLYCRAEGRPWDEGGQPLVQWTFLPRTIGWLRRVGLTVDRVDGDGWYVPIPGRTGGYGWNPPAWCRRAFTPIALHQLIEARHSPTRVLWQSA